MQRLKPGGENFLYFQFREEKKGRLAIDQQLERAPVLLFCNLIDQNYSVIPSVRFCDFGDKKVIDFLPESVIVLQRLAVF